AHGAGRRRHGVDVDRACEPVARSLRGLDVVPRDLHGRPPSSFAHGSLSALRLAFDRLRSPQTVGEELAMEATQIDAGEFRAGQRRDWGTAAKGWHDWQELIYNATAPVSERLVEIAG